MTAAPMESCRFVARRSPWGRFGSAVVACKRLHRTRHRLQHILANSLSRQRSFSKFRAGLGSETSRLLHRWRKRCRRLPTTRPTPRGLQEPICPRKKCAIWTRWRPVPGKNANYLRSLFRCGPDLRRSFRNGRATQASAIRGPPGRREAIRRVAGRE